MADNYRFVGGEAFVPSRVLREGWQYRSAPPSDAAPPADGIWQSVMLPDDVGIAESDALDHWFRLDAELPGGSTLEFRGLATLSEVWLDGALLCRHETMFRPLRITVPGSGGGRLDLCFRALAASHRRMKRPRWRNRLVEDETFRGVRTSLLGRMARTGRPVIGPFRPVVLHPPGAAPRLERLHATLQDGAGMIEVWFSGPNAARCAGFVTAGGQQARLEPQGEGLVARLTLPDPPLWWPHTHGEPTLVEVTASLDGQETPLGRTGFRSVERAGDGGLALRVNGETVFCRGALWSGGDEATLPTARSGGINMLRVPGYAVYPERSFFEACDKLGLLVWQDFMFARADYPRDSSFLEEAGAEARWFLDETAGSPSLAVLCGGHEVTQAAAMAGRPVAEWQHPLFNEILPDSVVSLRPDVVYVSNAPFNEQRDGLPPFAVSASVTHYFGIGGYLRPLSDSAGVRFAAACLAFANPEDPDECRALSPVPGDAGWQQAVPRDLGASWHFDDVRDHYVATLFQQDPASLRRTDPERWLAFGRAAVALSMQSAFAAWRTDPRCGGGLVLSWQDHAPGPGWGIMSSNGRPKSAFHALAGVLGPIQALLVDKGLDGVVAHLFNETARPRLVRLQLRGLTPGGAVQVLAETEHALDARGHAVRPATALMGRFQDLAGSWQFGPPPYRALSACLSDVESKAVLSDATIFPVSPLLPREDVGLEAVLSPCEPWAITLHVKRFAQFVMIDAGGYVPETNHLHLWPGETRRIALRASASAQLSSMPSGSVAALNGTAVAYFQAAA